MLRLNNGLLAPALGLGTWQAKQNEVKNAVLAAVRAGYRHIDGAAIYDNEKEIGEAYNTLFKEGTVTRSELFITSKLWNTMHAPSDVPIALKKTLSDLGLEYLDLYLIHWPLAFKRDSNGQSMKDADGKYILDNSVTIHDTWRAMEALVDTGKVKSIGVSNFTVEKLKSLLQHARIKPVVNQVEMHPYLPQHDLLEYCKANDIVVTAYSPLGSNGGNNKIWAAGQSIRGNILQDKAVLEIAKRNNKTPAQVLISWAIQRGTQVIPKSSNETRIRQNLEIFDLNDNDYKILNELSNDGCKRYIDPVDFWKIDVFGENKK